MQNAVLKFDGAMDSLKAVLRSVFEPMKSFLGIFTNFWAGALLTILVFVLLFVICTRLGGNVFSKETKKARTLAVCAMLVAINVVLETFARDLTSYIRVSFGFVTIPVAAMLFGPFAGCMVGILQDIAGFIVRPTGAFILPLTLNEGIAGMIMGLMLYKKKVTFVRILLAELIVAVFVNIILNSAALAPTVGSGLVGILPSRIIKNILLLPIQTAVIYAVLRIIKLRVKR